jgi:hypothetical protein
MKEGLWKRERRRENMAVENVSENEVHSEVYEAFRNIAVGLLGRQLSILGDSVAGYHTILSHGMRT